MVLYQDVHVVAVGVLAQLAQAVSGQLLLFLEGTGAGRVHPHRVAAQESRRLDPLVVILHRLRARRRVRRPDVALRVAHDEQARHALPVASGLEVRQVLLVAGAVEEEGVHVLDRLDPVAAGSRRKIEVVEFALIEQARVVPKGAVAQRAQARTEQLAEVGPFGQGNAVEGLGDGRRGVLLFGRRTLHAACGCGGGAQRGAGLQKPSAVHLHRTHLPLGIPADYQPVTETRATGSRPRWVRSRPAGGRTDHDLVHVVARAASGAGSARRET